MAMTRGELHVGRIGWYFVVIVCVTLLAVPVGVMASRPASPRDLIPYEEIAPTLYEIESNSNRVQVEVMGQSAGGRDLFLVTVADPQSIGRLGKYQALRHLMLKDPEKRKR